MEVSIVIGVPQNGWFSSWKVPNRNGWWLGVPPCMETPICHMAWSWSRTLDIWLLIPTIEVDGCPTLRRIIFHGCPHILGGYLCSSLFIAVHHLRSKLIPPTCSPPHCIGLRGCSPLESLCLSAARKPWIWGPQKPRMLVNNNDPHCWWFIPPVCGDFGNGLLLF